MQGLRSNVQSLEGLPGGFPGYLAWLNPGLEVDWIGRRLAHLAERPPALCAGRPFEEVFPAAAGEAIARLRTLLSSAEAGRLDNVALFANDGATRWDLELIPEPGSAGGLLVATRRSDTGPSLEPPAEPSSQREPAPVRIERQRQYEAIAAEIAPRPQGFEAPRSLFEIFMERLPAAAFIKDAHGQTLYSNSRRAEALGFASPQAVHGVFDHELIPPERLAEIRATDQRILATGQAETVLESPLGNGSPPRRWLVSKFPLTDSDGEPLLGGVATEVTEQLRLEAELKHSEERLRLIFETAPISIVIQDERAGTIVANHATVELTGVPASEIDGELLLSMTHPADAAVERLLFQELVAGKRSSYRIEKRFFPRGRPEIWVEINLAAGHDHRYGGRYFIATAVDVTERKRAESMKHEFVSVVSHELRTPLNTVMGMASILADELLGPLSADQRDCLDSALRGTEQLKSHINDLIDVGEMLAGRFKIFPEPFDLAMLIADAVEHMAPECQLKQHRVHAEFPESLREVTLDPQRLFQVMTRLIGNASKHSPANGTIAIRVACGAEEVLCEISDEGLGIAPDHLRDAFELFRQLDMSSTRQAGGIGLGLPIARNIIEAHGGTIGAHSEITRGSTFWFTLPLDGPPGLRSGGIIRR